MKKIQLIIFSALVFSLECNAQLEVASNGNVSIGNMGQFYESSFIKCGFSDNFCRNGMQLTTNSRTKDVSGQNNIALTMGNFKYSVASYNEAINVNGLYCFGVIGKSPSTYLTNHFGTGFNVGIYGIANDSISNYNNLPLGQGSYAGYFIGDTYVDGILTATSLYTPSDMRLKENVESLDVTCQGESLMDKIMAMNVIQYNYKDREYERMEMNVDVSEEMKEILEECAEKEAGGKTDVEGPKDLHFGLSAQELQEIFPNLVKEGQDGYLGVNYTELVPVLIRCIQGMQQEINELKGESIETRAKANGAIGETTEVKTTSTNRNQLFQNTPNPFKEQTTIRFSLANDVKSASVCIFDMQGKMLQSHPVQAGMESITVNGYELGAGMFLYSLVVNGQEMDTKKMILSK